jgi:hypothetical protein
MIIHKRNEPNLGRGQPVKKDFFRTLLCSGNLQECIAYVWQLLTCFLSKYGNFCTFFPKNAFVHFALEFFWSPQCRNLPKKKTLISALMRLRMLKILVLGWIDVVADMGGDTRGEFDF